jgi:eukaryotic-like serine/threonine-protein kinase
MNPQPAETEQWRKVRAILERALELPASERAAYVENACAGDPSGLAEVESLLRAAESPAWIDRPAVVPKSQNPSATPLPEGAMVGPYRISEKLGSGGMGVVYRAVDTRLDRTVALKVMSHEEGEAAYDRARFLREAKAASALNHPNIVIIYEYDSAAGRDYIAMELIEGPTLRELQAPGMCRLKDSLVTRSRLRRGQAPPTPQVFCTAI